MNSKNDTDKPKRKLRTLAQLKEAVEDMAHGGPSSDGGDGWIAIERDELRILLNLATMVAECVKGKSMTVSQQGLVTFETVNGK